MRSHDKLAGSSGAKQGLIVRDATTPDMTAVQTIYAHHVLHGLATFEEVPPSVEELLERRASVLGSGLPYLVAEIDGSFVREILRDPIDREMVRSINEIGHLTGKQTIAEFAENAEIIQMLTSLGVDYAQGYGVAQPQRVVKSAVA